MRVAYLDCFAGISGDMFLGALVDAGVPQEILHDSVAALHLDASLTITRVDRSGLSSIKVDVIETQTAITPHQQDDFREQRSHTDITHQPKTQHLHKDGHPSTHDDADVLNGLTRHRDSSHSSGRSLSVIRSLIQSSSLAEQVKKFAIHSFELLGASEAKIHNVDVEQIHFHEVGSVDAIVDIVAASAGIHALQIDKWYASPLNIGGGTVNCAHGRFPVPAPATADLLRGFPTYSAHVQQELVTPTGAAIIRALSPTFGFQPEMIVKDIGYGAGTRNPEGFPNVLRILVGESTNSDETQVAVIETAIDDLSPQILAHVTERALTLGAMDVMSTAVQMKKGRMGSLITILAEDSKVSELEELLLRETSTLGVRIHHERRICLDRKHVIVSTPFGDIRVKLGMRSGKVYNASPEFEDCRTAAEQHKVAVKIVQQAAIAGYVGLSAGEEV